MVVSIKQQLVSSRAVTSKGTNSRKYITIHETANTNKGANAQAHANLQSNGNSRQASWHYQVDDKQAIQSFPHSVICWHAGSSSGNAASIGVEICVNSDGDFKKAVANAAALVRKIMAQEGIPLKNIVQHNHWSGKNCPTNLRNGGKGISWHQFISAVNGVQLPQSGSGVLSYGDVGDQVKLYQGKLKQAGYKIDVDGSFGPATLKVVKQFQSENGLVVDGYLGPESKKKLEEILNAKLNQEKEVDELTQYMDEKLPTTQQTDAEKLFERAYKDGYFHVNHAPKVKNMTRRQFHDLKLSLEIREKLGVKVE